MKIVREKYVENINKWWNSNNKEALFILGVKNVGKTSLIIDWAKDNHIPYTYFGQDKYELIKDVFNDSKAKSFDTSLAIINKLMMPNSMKDLLIFDGIKPNDEIIVQIKKLCYESKHRYILISDYGERVFDNIRFLPVGSINRLIVEPLSFREYCNLRLNKYVIASFDSALSEPNQKYPFRDQFEDAWVEYSNYGGFPSVVSKLLEQGMPSAETELLAIKQDIFEFIEKNIPFSTNLTSILNNFGNKRSKSYHRFVFSTLSQNGTYQRYKRAVNILESIGIIGVLPIEGESINFEYYDMYLCDPGLERIWGGELDRSHIIESVVYSFGLRKKYKVKRLVLDKDKKIDLVYDTMIPWLIDIKQKNTNSSHLSELKFKNYMDNRDGTFKSYILVDKGTNALKQSEKVSTLPIWAFLLKE